MKERTKKEIKVVLSALYELTLTFCGVYCLAFLVWHRHNGTPVDIPTASLCIIGVLWILLRNAAEERKKIWEALAILTRQRKRKTATGIDGPAPPLHGHCRCIITPAPEGEPEPELIDRFGNPASKIDRQGYPID